MHHYGASVNAAAEALRSAGQRLRGRDDARLIAVHLALHRVAAYSIGDKVRLDRQV